MQRVIATLVVFPPLLLLAYNFASMDILSTVALATPALTFVACKRMTRYRYTKLLHTKVSINLPEVLFFIPFP